MKRIILHNAKVYIERNHFEEAVVVTGGRITFVGSNDEALKFYGEKDETKFIDCEGKTLIPGLNDSHIHLMGYGEKLYRAEIGNSKSIDEMIEKCKRFIEKYPERVARGLHAGGWNQDNFIDNQRMPERSDLDKISTDIPIVLERICGHIITVNSVVLEMLGLPKTHDGLLRGTECSDAISLIPGFTRDERKEILIAAMNDAVAKGVTSVQSNDIGNFFRDREEGFAVIKEIFEEGKARLRYRHQFSFAHLEEFREFASEYSKKKAKWEYGKMLTLGPLKLFKDGSLGARTALLKNDYIDDAGNRGQEDMTIEEMSAFVDIASENGIQVITHAIGDKAIADTITSYKVNRENLLRHGLVHCQLTSEEEIKRIIENDVLVFAQPIFIDFDMKIVRKLCGEELESTSYAFGTMLKEGAHLSYGTDCPVEDLNPFPNIYEAVTRKNLNGKPEEGYFIKESVDVYDAIDAYTHESAYAEFMEGEKGRIKPGYLADMVLLDEDVFACPDAKIKGIKPIFTMVNGKIIYIKNGEL